MIGIIISGQYNLYSDPNMFSGKIDPYMAVYCQKNPDLDICSCFETMNETPLCSDRKCQTAGYKSGRILSQNCDPYNNIDTIKGLVQQTLTAQSTMLAGQQSVLTGQQAVQASVATGQQAVQDVVTKSNTYIQTSMDGINKTVGDMTGSVQGVVSLIGTFGNEYSAYKTYF